MSVGIHFWNYTFAGGEAAILPNLGDTAMAAENAGLTLFTVVDHWFQRIACSPRRTRSSRPYSMLGYVAGVTERIQRSAERG